jgi:hypothetical protein
MWKKLLVYFKTRSWHLLGWTEKNHQNLSQIASITAEMRIRYLRNTTYNRYHLSQPDQFLHILKNVTEMNGYVKLLCKIIHVNKLCSYVLLDNSYEKRHVKGNIVPNFNYITGYEQRCRCGDIAPHIPNLSGFTLGEGDSGTQYVRGCVGPKVESKPNAWIDQLVIISTELWEISLGWFPLTNSFLRKR